VRTIIASALFCLIVLRPAGAGDVPAGFRFLDIPASADCISLGGVIVSSVKGADATAVNPAGLARGGQSAVSLFYLDRPLSLKAGGVGLGALDLHGFSLGFNVRYLSTPDIAETDDTGNFTGGSFSGADLLFTAAAARKITQRVALGVSAEFVHSSLADRSAQALAAGFGLSGGIDPFGLRGAVAVRHVGLMSGDYYGGDFSLPTTIVMGLSARPVGELLLGGIELEKVRDRDAALVIGGQIRPLDFLYFSVSRRFAAERDDRSWELPGGTAVGFGVELRRFGLKYAFHEAGRLGDESGVALNVDF
jgi:hypothetical protein